MVRPPPRSTLFPTRRSSDLDDAQRIQVAGRAGWLAQHLLRGHVGWSPDERAGLGEPDRALGHQRHTEVTEDHPRSEEHTSELQSRLHLVCRLLLEKKKETIV